tara:strand:- start:176 stop:370 length:195 start_codon:yes stop_codon:yes gene_type:complete
LTNTSTSVTPLGAFSERVNAVWVPVPLSVSTAEAVVWIAALASRMKLEELAAKVDPEVCAVWHR